MHFSVYFVASATAVVIRALSSSRSFTHGYEPGLSHNPIAENPMSKFNDNEVVTWLFHFLSVGLENSHSVTENVRKMKNMIGFVEIRTSSDRAAHFCYMTTAVVTDSIFWSTKAGGKLCFHIGLVLGLFTDPEGRGDVLLRNFGLL
jgi:hypothetical protein